MVVTQEKANFEAVLSSVRIYNVRRTFQKMISLLALGETRGWRTKGWEGEGWG